MSGLKPIWIGSGRKGTIMPANVDEIINKLSPAKMGGNLTLVAEFPDRPPVVLSGIAEDSLSRTLQE
jgi:hypothetical protein